MKTGHFLALGVIWLLGAAANLIGGAAGVSAGYTVSSALRLISGALFLIAGICFLLEYRNGRNKDRGADGP